MNSVEEIYKILLKEYGKQGWWPIAGRYVGKPDLNDEEKFEVCVGAILTQNTSWKNVEMALENLRKNNLFCKEKLKDINIKKLALLIKSSGYNNQKAKKIKEFISFLGLNKKINDKNLLDVWGVGKETADSILLYAFNQPYFVIDAYTKRIFCRLGFCSENVKYDKLQEFFHKNLEQDIGLFKEYHALLVRHAKEHCKKTPNCANCFLNYRCSYFRKAYIKKEK